MVGFLRRSHLNHAAIIENQRSFANIVAQYVPNIAFPCAALYDPDTGRMAIYYGGADTVTALAFARIDELINFVKTTSEL